MCLVPRRVRPPSRVAIGAGAGASAACAGAVPWLGVLVSAAAPLLAERCRGAAERVWAGATVAAAAAAADAVGGASDAVSAACRRMATRVTFLTIGGSAAVTAPGA